MIKNIIIILTCCSIIGAKAQDFHMSMYDAAPIFLNPAMTGLFNGNWRIHAQHRQQWRAVNYKPYNTSLISFDLPYKKWGFGVQIANYRAGIGHFNTFQGLLSVGYTVPLGKRKFHNLAFGVQGGITNRSVQYQLLSFDNQYTTTNGGGFSSSIPSGESFPSQSKNTALFNFGILYYFSKQESRINPFLGVSAFELLSPNLSFFGNQSDLPIRLYAHAGVRINISELFYILPKVLIMNQGNFNEQTFALDADYYFSKSDFHIIGGIMYRNKDALTLSVGMKKNNITGRIAYDVNTSTLTNTSSGRGAFELAVTYIFKREKSRETKICPRL